MDIQNITIGLDEKTIPVLDGSKSIDTKTVLEELKGKELESMISTSTVKVFNCDILHKEDATDTWAEPPIKKTKVDDNTIKYINESGCVDVSMGEDSNDRNILLMATDLEEDISDKAFSLRHERALNEERKKFQTYLKFPWSTRSRANRRIDSRAESSGANTPDPASPAPNTPSLVGVDQDSIPSPLAPSTPITPLDAINETSESGQVSASATSAHSSVTIAPPAFPIIQNSSKRNERRRTTSARNQHLERNERRSLTPDTREITIPPFEPLNFPLNDEEFNLLSSVTLLPPSVGNFYTNIGVKHQEDYDGGGGTIGGYLGKSITSRNNRRGSLKNAEQHGHRIAAAAISSNCYVNFKRPRLKKFQSIKVRSTSSSSNSNTAIDKKAIPPYLNGQKIDSTIPTNVVGNISTTIATTDNDDDFIDEVDYEGDYFNDIIDGEDDGYSKHPLAPGNDDIQGYVDDEEYKTFSGVNNSNSLLGVSDTESSDADPFQDDDPNDPEWKGELRTERPERIRKRS